MVIQEKAKPKSGQYFNGRSGKHPKKIAVEVFAVVAKAQRITECNQPRGAARQRTFSSTI
jgi:hypothetical protein